MVTAITSRAKLVRPENWWNWWCESDIMNAVIFPIANGETFQMIEPWQLHHILFHKSISGFGLVNSAKEPFRRQRSIGLFSSGWHESRLDLLKSDNFFFHESVCWFFEPNFLRWMLRRTLQFHGFSIKLFLQLQCSWPPNAAIVNESQFEIGWRRPWGDTRDLSGILQHHRLL